MRTRHLPAVPVLSAQLSLLISLIALCTTTIIAAPTIPQEHSSPSLHVNSTTSATNSTSNTSSSETQCILSCNQDFNPVCGSDGHTYTNICEMNLTNCLQNSSITLKSFGNCPNCSLERLRRKSLPAASQLRFKCARRDVTINELTADRLFEPSCSIDDPTQFSIVQKHSTCGVYWCSTASGFAIEDTLSWHKKPDCSGRKACLHMGVQYKDGDVFKPSCGVCQCLNGNISCIEDYCGSEGNLTDLQINVLKKYIFHLIFFQYQRYQHIIIDLIYIKNNPLVNTPASHYTNSMLTWKFNYYDKNNNKYLQPSEIYHFHGDIFQLVGIKHFKEQLQSCMDSDKDGHLSQAEFYNFFTTDTQCEGSGSGVANSGDSRIARSATGISHSNV